MSLPKVPRQPPRQTSRQTALRPQSGHTGDEILAQHGAVIWEFLQQLAQDPHYLTQMVKAAEHIEVLRERAKHMTKVRMENQRGTLLARSENAG